MSKLAIKTMKTKDIVRRCHKAAWDDGIHEILQNKAQHYIEYN